MEKSNNSNQSHHLKHTKQTNQKYPMLVVETKSRQPIIYPNNEDS